MNFKDLPKVELHCHLDGSLRVDTVLEKIEYNLVEDDNEFNEVRKKYKELLYNE